MSEKSRRVFNYIRDYIRAHKYAPSYEEIGNGCELKSKASVCYHVNKLIKDNWLETDHERCPRALRLSLKGERLP